MARSDPLGRGWLFEVSAAPTERRDLSGERPEMLAELHGALAACNTDQARADRKYKRDFGVLSAVILHRPDCLNHVEHAVYETERALNAEREEGSRSIASVRDLQSRATP